MAAVHAVHDTLKALRAGTPTAKLVNIASPDLMKQVSRGQEYAGWIESFLGGPSSRASSDPPQR